MQTRLESWLEAISNVVSGYLIAISAQLLVYPLYGIHLPLVQQFQLAGVFVLVSLARSYLIRRFWNRRLKRLVKKRKSKELKRLEDALALLKEEIGENRP